MLNIQERDDLICNTCQKKQYSNRLRKYQCMVLHGDMPAWGEGCTAYTENKDWLIDVNRQVKKYKGR